MTQLVASVEHELTTDFGMLGLEQGVFEFERPDALCFATSTRGAIGMICGTKNARVRIRLERWDTAPPPDRESWEDHDVLPFEAVDGLGPLSVLGFDRVDGEGLPADGLSRSRVRICARGRHRYGYSSLTNLDLPPEDWLLQFWPDPLARDGLAGEPRRVAGLLPYEYRRTAWEAALHGWAQTGWEALLAHVPYFTSITHALRYAGGPCSLRELPALAREHHASGVPRTTDMETPLAVERVADHEWTQTLLARLAEVAGMSALTTVGDLLTALLRLGLLARYPASDDDYVTPNPSPRHVWEAVDLPDDMAAQLRIQALRQDYEAIQWDLMHLLRWAPNHVLRARPRQIAIRLAVPVADVLGGFQLLQAQGRWIDADTDLNSLRADEELIVRLRS